MKTLNIDIYKSILLLILAVFVYCYYDNSRIGRFKKLSERKRSGYNDFLILDSKNGATYIIDYDGDGKVRLNSHTLYK
jgi:hypothetical protein